MRTYKTFCVPFRQRPMADLEAKVEQLRERGYGKHANRSALIRAAIDQLRERYEQDPEAMVERVRKAKL